MEQTSCKICILGLDNSGKTSILLSFNEDTNIMSFCSLKPTKGIVIHNIESGSMKISCWDFGGQKQFRNEYLQNLTNYVEKAEKIIYVIDIQDTYRYDLSIEYFREIIDILEKNEKKIDISIFLHKYDPNLKNRMEFQKIDEKIDYELISNLKHLIKEKFNFQIFKTSIFTVFNKHLV